jgi:hypothetical protein
VTRYNMAMIYRAQGELGQAVAEQEQVVELDRQVGHPDLQSDTEMLHRVRQELASPDRVRGAAMTSVARRQTCTGWRGRPGSWDRIVTSMRSSAMLIDTVDDQVDADRLRQHQCELWTKSVQCARPTTIWLTLRSSPSGDLQNFLYHLPFGIPG